MDSKFTRVRTDEDEKICQYSPSEKWRIWRNVLMISAAFMVHFTAFWGASNLQSSVNSDASLGTFTLSAIYGSLLLSNIFLPVAVIRWLGCKWTITFSFITYMPFIISQFYPTFYTMIPAGLAVGLGGGPLWCAKCTYLTVVSEAYSQITGIASDVLVTRFLGVFFMFYQFSQVWGNLISSAVLSIGIEDTSSSLNSTISNATLKLLDEFEEDPRADLQTGICGANFCKAVVVDSPNLARPPASRLNLMTGIFLGCMVVASLLTLGVDSLKRYDNGRKGSGNGLSGLKLLAVTLKHLANPYQLLILPITMFIGAEQAFLFADYTASFVSCGWGISNIGFVMICFGVCNGIASPFIGAIVKITGRSPIIAFALALHVALIVSLLVWDPATGSRLTFFAIAGLWGIADAVWLVQINALCGILFPGKEEASYSNFRLWESTGSVITYAYNPYLCTDVKLYLLLGLLMIGVSGYTVIEYLEHQSKDGSKGQKKKKFELVNASLKSGEVAE